MSGGAWLGLVFLAVFVGGLLLMIVRLVLLFRGNEEPVSGASWGRQLFGPRQRR